MNNENENILEQDGVVEVSTKWANPPTLAELNQDMSEAKPAKDLHTQDVTRWLDNLNVEGSAKPKERKGKSSIQPKLIRKNNEWRYPSLSEPFLITQDIFKVSPYTFEDKEAARQNALVLNHQFNFAVDKVAFIDEYVRTAVDEGTVFVRVGWEFMEEEKEVDTPVYGYMPATSPKQLQELQYYSQKPANHLTEEWKQALMLSQSQGRPIIPYVSEIITEPKMVTTKNAPTVEVVDHRNLIIDPSCNGDLDKANFVIYSFETNKSDLEALGIYHNIENISVGTNSILNASDDEYDSNDDSSFNFKDEPRKKFVAHEYWGYWDIDGSGVTKPIVVTWVGNTIIRMEENPYPDKKIPFVSAQYLPVRKSLFGEPDGEVLEDNQKVVGAVTRGMIDILAKSANSQTGIRKDMLDTVNRAKYLRGEDYEFNQIADPRQGIFMHTFNEIPGSAQFMLQAQQQEAEAMTGVRPYGATNADLSTATEARGVLDAASKREVSILRRLAKGITSIGMKFISMNQEFLEDEEIIRITNEEFIEIKREELAGQFDLVLDISTAEEDNAKAQELAFMLQTVGPNSPPEMTNMIMADIAELRKMPDLAKRLKEYKPEPDPIAVATAQAELEKLKLENAKIQLEMAKLQSEVELNAQKAGVEGVKQGNIQADTDLKNLEYVEEELGVNHERELEKNAMQAKSNLQRDILVKAMDAQTKDTSESK